jgi:hypothetical protein
MNGISNIGPQLVGQKNSLIVHGVAM